MLTTVDDGKGSGGRRRKRTGPTAMHLEARERLREMIVTGQLKPGERIDERGLCEAFGLSRTPIREALKVLAVEGLVELLPNRGTRVAKPSGADIARLFQVIAALERLAAELTAASAPAADLRMLRADHDEMVRMYRAGRREEYFALNQRIHETVIALTGNPVLIRTHADLMTRARRPRYIAITSQERWDESVREHELLMAALEIRDSRSAGDILFNHVLKTGEVVRASLEAEAPLPSG
ncbi:GntR family transcriptional regulator [Azospirillum sp. ST 5-10]|uniref:GntR family transcriptional regulator n=1 Tax=unclassified Azospirillum TaxID=2630922 RepID=UPI003F49BE9B